VRVLVRCLHGVEWVAAAEVGARLPAADVRLARREVAFTLPAVDAALLGLRCADDAFVVVGEVPAADPTRAGLPPLAAAVAALDWAPALAAVTALRDGAPAAFAPVAFDCVASIEGRRSHNRSAAEDAVGAALAPVLGLRFAARTPGGPAPVSDVAVRLFLRPGTALVALRVGERPLHRRGWKRDTGPGTLHPPLAAALAALAGAEAEAVLDPFCGDGTLAVEAALRGGAVTATDRDPARVDATLANAGRAGVRVAARVADAADLAGLDAADLLLTNPPWGVAVAPAGRLPAAPADWWGAAAGVLRGRAATVVDADLGLPDALRRGGWTLGAVQAVRVAGRVAHLVLAAPPGAPAPRLPAELARWRDRARADGVVTDDGF
jgi:23S rRNA G2445 N2-methylase RlmL